MNVEETNEFDSAATELDLEQLTALFRLLSDKTRLNILLLLAGGERNVSWLCSELKLPQPTVSHHLGLLRLHSILGNRRAGKQIFYQLNGRVDQEEGTGGLSIHTERYVVKIAGSSTRTPLPPLNANDATEAMALQ